MRRQPPESVFEIIPGLDAETKKKLVQAVRKQPEVEKMPPKAEKKQPKVEGKKPAAKRERKK
jgi:hypothetical protein